MTLQRIILKDKGMQLYVGELTSLTKHAHIQFIPETLGMLMGLSGTDQIYPGSLYSHLRLSLV